MHSSMTIDELFPNEVGKPIEFDPYHGRCPKTVLRSMRTPDEVTSDLRQMAFIRGLSAKEISERAAIEQSLVEQLMAKGKGSVSSLYKVCSVLGIEPVIIPLPQVLSQGMVAS